MNPKLSTEHMEVGGGECLARYAKLVEYPIVELGSWKGKSTVYLAEGSLEGNKVRVYAVDTWNGSNEHHKLKIDCKGLYEQFLENIRDMGLEHIITPIRENSHNLKLLALPNEIGLLFIDADHDYENVKSDFERYSPLLVVGGFLIFHDYGDLFPGVVRTINELDKTKFVFVEKVGALGIFRRTA